MRDLEAFVTLDPSHADEVPPDRAASLVWAITYPCHNGMNNDLLIALLDTEGLNDLRDPDLRDAIGGWRTAASAFSRRSEQIGWIHREVQRALGRHAVVRPTLMAPLPNDAGAPQPVTATVLRAAREDDEIVALAAAKVADWRILHVLVDRSLRRSAEAVVATARASKVR